MQVLNINTMNVCYFGNYNKDHTRNQILLEAFKKQNIKLFECNATDKKRSQRWIKLVFKFIKIYRKIDIIFLGPIGHFDVLIAYALGKIFRKKVVIDIFVSLYDTEVKDRKRVRADSNYGRFLWRYDQIACNLPDIVLVDTIEHKKYFIEEFNAKLEKIKILPIGAIDIFEIEKNPPKDKISNSKFTVLFYGSYIPLHGIEYIIEAAEKLKNKPIQFQLIGNGQTYALIKKLSDEKKLSNVKFIETQPIKDLIEYIDDADICLGIFGDTEKAKRVVPNKIYQCIARGKCIITQKTKAVEEIFIDKKDIILSENDEISDSILYMYKNKDLIRKCGNNARSLFMKNYTTYEIGNKFKSICNEINR
jgi:glycosyltransferase involved in cell wall biosynthesis